ncbi:MAG: riboflavin synthase [Gammaproteobacteria bacterium]|nr:riboflavin synthase [Gammaproteobacteria bacterium]
MFTGIIQATGEIKRLDPRGGDMRLSISSPGLEMGNVSLGDSIAVNGVCLTVIEWDNSGFSADVSRESLERTTLGSLAKGNKVNLEKALTLQTPLGGHLVSGHVDGVGEIIAMEQLARAKEFWVRAPAGLAKYIAEKGSICIDGISLTVNAIKGAEFRLTIVPHTLDVTTMSQFSVGQKVNLEVDIIARYLERLLLGDKAAEQSDAGITEAFLAEHGFKRS